MGKHIRIIKKEVYERLSSLREEMYQDLLAKYMNDPDYTKYEDPNDQSFRYCKAVAWSEADAATIGREVNAARDTGHKDPDYKTEDCGCCDNMIIMLPSQKYNGDWEIVCSVETRD